MTANRFSILVALPWLLLSSQGIVAVEIHEIGDSSRVAPSSSKVTTTTSTKPAVQTQPQARQATTRQVAPVSSAPKGNTVLINIARQQQELQREVERLRSDNEELNHTIEGLQSRLRSMYSDLDRRIQEIEKRGVAPAAAAAVSPVAGDSLAESKAYEHAFNLLRNKRYEPAIKAFDRFLKTYPNSEFADNAQYWIGEGYYVTRDFKAAAKSFNQLISTHPKSAKIADAHLKLGFSHYEMAEYKSARKSLGVVTKQHGKTTAARLAKERLDRMTKEGH